MSGLTRELLEELYFRFNRPEFISPDPLEVVIQYEDIRDREIVGLIAAALAYGRVAQIIKSVKKALEPLGASPRDFLDRTEEPELLRLLPGFKHRFTAGADLGAMLVGVKRATAEFGSLNQCFLDGHSQAAKNVLPALSAFTRRIACGFPGGCTSLLSSPERSSACKRMNLYLKWMVRRDAVDPGGWLGVSPAQLIVPLDSHMFRICGAIGLSSRKSPNIKTALDVTEGFARLCPEDPTKYDFAITRLGIRSDQDPAEFIIKANSGV